MPRGRRGHRGAGVVPRRAARLARSRCARRSGARSGGWRSWRRRTPGSRSSATRPPRSRSGCAGSRRSSRSASRSTSSRCRCGSSASTSRTSRGARSSPRWRSFDRRAAAAGALPHVRDAGARRARTTSRRWAQAVGRRFARLRDADDPARHDESFAQRPNLVVIDGGKGQLAAALEAIAADARAAAPGGRVAREARGGGVRPGPSRADPADRHDPGLQLLHADPRRGAPHGGRAPPQAARHAGVRVDLRRPRRHRPGAAAGDPAAFRHGRAVPAGDAGGARGRPRAAGAHGAGGVRAAPQGAGPQGRRSGRGPSAPACAPAASPVRLPRRCGSRRAR